MTDRGVEFLAAPPDTTHPKDLAPMLKVVLDVAPEQFSFSPLVRFRRKGDK